MIRSHVASPLRLQLWAFEACGPLNFLSTQWPGACSIELIPNINAAATNNKAACKSWKIYNLKAGNYFFFPVWKFFLFLVNNFLQKSQLPQGGFLVVITFLSCCITHPSFLPPPSHHLPLPYHASSNLQNGNHLRHQNYCWRWKGDESQVPCSACLLGFLMYHVLYFTHQDVTLKSYTAWRIEEATEKRGKGEAEPSCYCSCLTIKKTGKDSQVWQQSQPSRQCLTHE